MQIHLFLFKRTTLKEIEFAPLGANSFLLELNLFQGATSYTETNRNSCKLLHLFFFFFFFFSEKQELFIRAGAFDRINTAFLLLR